MASPPPCAARWPATMQFNISKLQMVEAEKQRIRTEFERRESAIEVKKKVRVGGPPAVWIPTSREEAGCGC